MDTGRDQVGFGSSRPPRRWLTWPVWLVLGAAAIAVVVFRLASHRPAHHPVPRPPAAVTDLHHRLLGVTARWELLGWGPRGVVRIQLARGRITRTTVPPLGSTGPVTFVVTPTLAIVRPLDFVPGYEVPDRGSARQLPGLLDRGGPVVAGPSPGQMWVVVQGIKHTALSLAEINGQPAGAYIQLPAGGPPGITASPDGRGYVLLAGAGGVYDTGPSGLHWVARSMAAVGPTRWLAVACRPVPPGRHRRCRNEVIDTARGAKQVLPGPAVPGQAWPPGVISPDGSAAAVFTIGGGGEVRLSLISLDTGASRALSVPISQQSPGGQMLAWSPDGKWLFVVAAHGRLLAIEASTGRVTGLGVTLPPLQQIGVRNAPG